MVVSLPSHLNILLPSQCTPIYISSVKMTSHVCWRQLLEIQTVADMCTLCDRIDTEDCCG